MATKKKTTKAVASMKEIENQLKAFAKAGTERLAPEAGNNISLGGRRFSYKGEEIGTELTGIVLDFVRANDFYDHDYDPDKTFPPGCFMRAESEDDEYISAEISPNRQSEYCSGCPKDAFGTADKGEGKACRNSYKLAFMETGGDPDTAEIAFLSVPPSSLKNWAQYVKTLSKKHERPPFAVVTRFSFDPKFDHQVLIPEFEKKITDAKTLGVILSKQAEYRKLLMAYPDISNYEAPTKKSGAKTTTTKKKTNKKAAATSGKKKTTKKTGRSKFGA